MADSSGEDPSIRRFNESFYRGDPADYLATRLQLLMLASCRSQELAAMVREGLEYAGVSMSASDDPPDDPSSDDLENFMVVESQQLLHHAAETALRIWFAHSTPSEVPWIDLAGRRNFERFKRDVRTTFVDGRPDPQLVAMVCLGRSSPFPGATEDDWRAAIDGLTQFLRVLAERFLDDAPIYNGIKHGLGVSAGSAVVLIDGATMGSGVSIEIPESTAWDANGTRTWSLTTRWLDLPETLGLIDVARRIIDSMWKIGQARHVEGPREVSDLFFPVTLRPSELRSKSGRSPMRRMSWTLLTETRTLPLTPQ